MTTLVIVGAGLVLMSIAWTAYEVGALRGLREGCEIYEDPFKQACRGEAKYRRLWLYHRAKGARLRRCLWEIRKALDSGAPGERSDL